MLVNVPGHEDIGDADRARAMFWLGQRAVHVPLKSLRGEVTTGRVPLDRFRVPSDGTDATSKFEAALIEAASLGITHLQGAEGGTYALENLPFPLASFDIDFNGSTLQATYTAGLEGTHNIITANVQTNVGGTNIGDLTGGGGLAAAMDGDNSKTYAQCATVAATTGYIGKTPTSSVKVSRAIVYGSSDKGFVTGAQPTVTLSLYGKTGSAPASGTDGTLLGSISFTDVPSSLTYNAEVGDFSAAEVITGGTSGATATLSKIVQLTDDPPTEVAGTGILYFGEITTGPFVVGETITGGTSGATATIRTVQTPRRVIVSKDKTTEYAHVWVYKSSTTASTGIAMVEFHEAAEHELVFRNVRVNGGWPGSGSAPTTSAENTILVKGYRKFEIENFYATACNWGNANQSHVLLERQNAILESRNNDLTIVDGYTAEGNRATEGLLLTSDDATHIAALSDVACLNQVTSGSNVNALNLGAVMWRDGYISGANAGPNLASHVVHLDNIHLSDITDKGIDTSESLFYPRLVTAENCTFTNVDDGALILAGVAYAGRNHFTACGVPIQAVGSMNSGALESVAGAGDAAWGEWVAQVERANDTTLDSNTFDGVTDTANPNIQIIGTTSNPATVRVHGADREATGNTQPNSSVQLRSVKRATLTGTFYDGVEAVVDHDGGADLALVMDGDFHPQSGAHTMICDRASATLVAPSVTVFSKVSNKRHGSLAASHYDFAKGANPGTYTAIYMDGPSRLTLDPTIPATTPVIRNGRWYETSTADANFSLTPGTSATEVRHTGTLTADRSVSLATASAVMGDRFRVTRTGGGAFGLLVGTGPLKSLATNTWCEVTYDGSAWYLSAYGAL